MVFISAGHNTRISVRTGKIDPGAVANGHKEADLTVELRNLVAKELDRLGVRYITDKDNESLGEYLARIKTGDASVVLEFHFDAAGSTATGSTGIIEAEADRLDRAFATEVTTATARTLGIRNRGVITEAQSHRGSLGLMREQGIICLLEVGFITNMIDLASYKAKKRELARAIAPILKRYEDLIT
jgi:N-acetylmuramoyl-L-alanine amidase